MTIWVGETESTNTLLSRRGEYLPDGAAVVARIQSGGRGQRGNSWEAEPGKNVTMSMLLRNRGVDIRRGYCLSEAVALGAVDLLESLGIEALVKWPNDIYVGNRKIAGILIENQLSGTMIERSIVGIGLNVNQRVWRSDAPNPVSASELTDKEYDVRQIATVLQKAILRRLEGDVEANHTALMARLWRREGFHRYRDELTGEDIWAKIVEISPSGHICMEMAGGGIKEYMFKEITVR